MRSMRQSLLPPGVVHASEAHLLLDFADLHGDRRDAAAVTIGPELRWLLKGACSTAVRLSTVEYP